VVGGFDSAEARRLDEADGGGVPWRRWGPYLSVLAFDHAEGTQ
jgi:hypothetical protein